MVQRKKTVAKKTSIKKKTPAKRATQSNRARVAGIPIDTDDDVPDVIVRVRQKGIRGRPQKWHRDKLMAYVCEKISEGRLVSDVCRKIGIKVPRFWEIARSTEIYRSLYAQARKDEAEQMRVYAQKVAEGRDWITLRERKRIETFRKKNKRNPASNIIASARESNILGRNRLQLDAAKWIAKVTDPEKFGDKQSLSVGGQQTGDAIGITLRFVDAKGKSVTP